MWCIDCFYNTCSEERQTVEDEYIPTTSTNERQVSNDPFSSDDFTDFFNNDIILSRPNGNYDFQLVQHKLIDVADVDLELSITNTDGQIKGGGDNPPVDAPRHFGSAEDVSLITSKVRQYTSVDNFDLRVPGLRHKQVERLTRLKQLYLRKLSFYVDEDSFLMTNWEVAAMRNNERILTKVSKFTSKEKIAIVTLSIHTDWLRAALESVRDLKISVGVETECSSDVSSHGLDLASVYALEDLTGAAPHLVKNIALSIFSANAFERATSKLGLVLQRNAHKYFSADKICETMLRICRAANLNFEEFHSYMLHLRSDHLPMCPCGHKGATIDAWSPHGCRYEAWVLRIGIAETVGGYLHFSPFDWSAIINLAGTTDLGLI